MTEQNIFKGGVISRDSFQLRDIYIFVILVPAMCLLSIHVCTHFVFNKNKFIRQNSQSNNIRNEIRIFNLILYHLADQWLIDNDSFENTELFIGCVRVQSRYMKLFPKWKTGSQTSSDHFESILRSFWGHLKTIFLM